MSVVRRNVAWVLGSQFATWGVSLLLLVVAPRKLGEHAFGQMSFAMVYVAFFELVGQWGTSTLLTKLIARDRSSLARYVSNTLVLKVLAAIVLTILALGAASGLGYEADIVLLIAIFCISMVCNLVNNVFVGGLQGLQEMGRPAIFEVMRMYAGAAVGVAILLNGGGLVAYVLAFNLASLIPVVGNGLALLPRVRPTARIDVSVWRTIVTQGFPFFVLAALLAVYGSIDIPMLRAMADDETVGWYALAYRWVSMPAFFAAAVATAFFPALSAEGVRITEAFSKLANRALQLVVFVSAPAAIGIALIAGDFIDRLYAGSFQQSTILMQILALHIPIVALDIILGTVVISADRQRQFVVFSAVAACFNPLLNLAAIPLTVRWFDNGAIGAAFTTVLTELIMMGGAIALAPRGVLDAPTRRLLTRVVVAALAMIPVVLALGWTPLPVQVTAGVVAYVAASFVLRTISVSELSRWWRERAVRSPEPSPPLAPTLARGSETGL